MKKYFISCINLHKQLGVIQLECEENELKKKTEELCPVPAKFRAYEVEEFDNIPINEFITAERLKELGY